MSRAVIALVLAASCGQPSASAPCRESAYRTGCGGSHAPECSHPDHRLVVEGEIVVCRCLAQPAEEGSTTR